jgi:NADP-reducing hydrogenase subunit HndC
MKTIRSMVLVSGDSRSLANGAEGVFQQLQADVQRLGLADEVAVALIGEVGRSDALPLVIVYPEAVLYGPVTRQDTAELVREHLYKGRLVERLRAPVRELSGRIAWLAARQGTLPAERRVLLARAGQIDPEEIEDYILHDGYAALGQVLADLKPADVIAQLEAAGLRGRGGAGFPTGRKLKFVAQAPGEVKYIVCNADESEPGTFKDRLLMEADPHALLEAMAIAGYAVGASSGYIYIRGEYRLAHARLEKAIAQARGLGLLGDDLFGSGFGFDIHLHAGAGAYICGEETALLESLEGRRGEPRSRPPYPVTHGLWGKPTAVVNVETLANIPPIMRHGAAWYRTLGTPSSPGTKLYTVMGNVNTTGLIEVPMGITLREVITIYAKGMKGGAALKLAQTGGSSGSVIPASLQDTPMDYDSYGKLGVALGSGALLICNEETCAVDLVRVLLRFFRHESCGKCTPCRVGTEQALQILTRIGAGQGRSSDPASLEHLAQSLEKLSNCGLGQTAAQPLRDLLRHFRAELEAHLKLGVCPAGACEMTSQRAAAGRHLAAGTGS